MDFEEVTTEQRGKQHYEIKFDCINQICYIRCTVPYNEWDFVKAFGIPLIPWKMKKVKTFYFDGWERDWKISDHYTPTKATYRFKLNAKDHAPDISIMHAMWINHYIHLAKKAKIKGLP